MTVAIDFGDVAWEVYGDGTHHHSPLNLASRMLRGRTRAHVSS